MSRSPKTWLFDLDDTLHNASHRAFKELNASMAAYMVTYLVLAVKRVYRTTVVGALWRTAVIGPIYMAVLLVTAIGIGLGWLILRSPGALPH